MAVSYQRSVVSNHRTADSLALATQNPKSKIQNPPEPSPQHPEPAAVTLFNPPIEFLASLTEEDFRKLFAHSPIKRAKYRGWLRNLCVAMGNSGDVRLLARLQKLSRHPDPVIREHAEWALDQLRQS